MFPRLSGSQEELVSRTRIILRQDQPPGQPPAPFCASRRELLTIVHHFCASRSSSKVKTMGSAGEPRTVSSWHAGLLTL